MDREFPLTILPRANPRFHPSGVKPFLSANAVGTTVVAPPFQFITCIKSPWPSILAAFVCWVYTAAPQITLGITPGGALGVTAQIPPGAIVFSFLFNLWIRDLVRETAKKCSLVPLGVFLFGFALFVLSEAIFFVSIFWASFPSC